MIDTLKGSYYANPVIDEPQVASALREAYPEYYGNNICENIPRSYRVVMLSSPSGPSADIKDIQGFQEAFKDLGGYSDILVPPPSLLICP